MALKSYILDPLFSTCPDIDTLPVSVWLGGRNISLVTTDEGNEALLSGLGFFLMEAIPGAMSCGRRMVYIDRFGAIPRDIETTDEEVWDLDEPLPVL